MRRAYETGRIERHADHVDYAARASASIAVGLDEISPLTASAWPWRRVAVAAGGIANILHRGTIAVLVGSKVFERGEACFASGRVLRVEAASGELRGSVRPEVRGRPIYSVRIWIRDEGLAYECSCPMGVKREFCKHTVAIALAHLEQGRLEVERELALLRRRVMAVDPMVFVDRLLDHARTDPSLAAVLAKLTEQ